MTAPDTDAIRARTATNAEQCPRCENDWTFCGCTAYELQRWYEAAAFTLCEALDEARAKIGNLHAVEKQHRDTANEQFHRAERLRAENERLRAALTQIAVGEGTYGAQAGEYKAIARAALAQKRGEA